MALQAQDIVEKLKKYPIAVAGGLVALIAVVVVVLRSPGIEAAQMRLDEQDRTLSTYSRNAGQSVGLEADLAKIDELNQILDERLMDRRELSRNQTYFYALENRYDVAVEARQTTGVSAAGGEKAEYLPELKEFELVRFNLTLSGPFDEVLAYLHEVETGRYFARYERFSVRPDTTTAQPGAIAVEVTYDMLGRKVDAQ